ncbi:hypothetical protein LTR62_000612 [Meristemomyces frigidus]|uniref:RING-type domain-containing protein n=1 Tax=Meristemomyces frigidus TaxID=1508187 RepID=A0AAN7YGS3_9PEZI|nr:hypothetical protein LTR62_000612 [Meristemomyces frigidus]
MIRDITKRTVTGSQIRSAKNALQKRMIVEFDGAPNLASFAANLNDQKVQELGNGKLFVVEKVHVIFTIWQDRKVVVHIDDEITQPAAPGRPAKRVEITLKGTNRPDISLAKSAIDGVFANAIDKQLRNARKLPGVQTHRIRLTKTKHYRTAIKPGGGLERAPRIVGADVVVLDQDSEPPAIVVRGSGAVLRRVKEALRMSPSDMEAALTCTICYVEMDSAAIMPGCGHSCCKDCFASYCSTDVGTEFPLRCFNTNCEAHIPVQLVCRELEDTKFKDFLQGAVTEHLRQAHSLRSYTTEIEVPSSQPPNQTRFLQAADQAALRTTQERINNITTHAQKIAAHIAFIPDILHIPELVRNPETPSEDRYALTPTPYHIAPLRTKQADSSKVLQNLLAQAANLSAHVDDLQTTPYTPLDPNSVDQPSEFVKWQREISSLTMEEKRDRLKDLQYDEEAKQGRLNQGSEKLVEVVREIELWSRKGAGGPVDLDAGGRVGNPFFTGGGGAGVGRQRTAGARTMGAAGGRSTAAAAATTTTTTTAGRKDGGITAGRGSSIPAAKISSTPRLPAEKKQETPAEAPPKGAFNLMAQQRQLEQNMKARNS